MIRGDGKWRYLRGDDKTFGRKIKLYDGKKLRPLTSLYFHLKEETRKGDEGYEDVSCVSKLTICMIHEVIEDICTKFHWVTDVDIISLVTGSAGGHGM